MSKASAYATFTAGLLFLVPIHFGGLSFFNEPVFVVATAGAVWMVAVSGVFLSTDELTVVLVGALFSCVFLLIALVNIPHEPIIKDVVECLKPLLYTLFVVAAMRTRYRVSDASVVKYILAASVGSILFSTLVFVEAAHPIVNLFKGRQSTDSWNFHFERFSGTLGYPDVLGMWLVLSTFLAISAGKRGTIRPIASTVIAGACVLAIVMTGSRSAVAVLVAMAGLFFAVAWRRLGTRIALGVFVMIALLGLPMALPSLGEDATALVYLRQGVTEGINDGSFLHRLREFEVLAEQFRQGDLLGVGPNNAWIERTWGPVESGFFYYGYKFGFAGLLFMSVLLGGAAVVVLREWQSDNQLSLPAVSSMWAICTVSVGGISMSVTEEYKSFFLFFSLVGIVIASVREAAFRGRPLNGPERVACQSQVGAR